MTDFFLLFDESRRPWLDPAPLKEKFLALSSATHPDRIPASDPAARQAAQERFAEINAGYQILQDTARRIGHLLELERGATMEPVERIPNDLGDLFFEISRFCREIDLFLKKRPTGRGGLAEAQWMVEAARRIEPLGQFKKAVAARQAELEAELRDMNSQWEKAPPPNHPERSASLPLKELEELCRRSSYLNRWGALLEERRTLLTIPR